VIAHGLTQRLAAILAADAEGFSRQMASDERATVDALDAARAIFRAAIEANRGRVVDMAGDSVLAVFPTASAAVAAALETQRELESPGAGPIAGAQLHFRVGVHLGEVIEKADGSVYGDGVNIASRLQALAEPGGVVVSEAVRGAVGTRLGLAFDDLGEQRFKNIAEPVHALRVRPAAGAKNEVSGGWQWRRVVAPMGSQRRRAALVALIGLTLATGFWAVPWPRSKIAQGQPPELTVAVMPFATAEGSPDDAAWADALTQSTTTALSRWRWASVVAPSRAQVYKGRSVDARSVGHELNVRYLVEGETRTLGAKVRVTLRVVETERGTQAWAWQTELDAPPTPQARSRTAMLLAYRVRGALVHAVIDRASRRVTTVSPLDETVRGMAVRSRDENAGWRAAQPHFVRALQLDPDYVPALVQQGWGLEREYQFTDASDAKVLASLDAVSARAVALDPLDDDAWQLRSFALAYLFRWGEAFAAAERAISLAPYDPNYVAQRAYLHSTAGRQAEAEAGFLEAIAMDPPADPYLLRPLCAARLLMGHHAEAAPDCERAAVGASWYEDHLLLTAIYAHQGDAARTALARAELLKQRPGLTIENNLYRRLSDVPAFQQQVREHLETGLRKAGIPER